MINNLLLVGAGGAAGSMLRYLCQRSFNTLMFPYGTLLVNIAGCFIVGLLAGIIAKNQLPDSLRLLFVAGFCGGFTTFSAFAYEGLQFMQKGQWLVLSAYISVSVFAGLLACFFGYKLFI
jgi:CrcB protein